MVTRYRYNIANKGEWHMNWQAQNEDNTHRYAADVLAEEYHKTWHRQMIQLVTNAKAFAVVHGITLDQAIAILHVEATRANTAAIDQLA